MLVESLPSYASFLLKPLELIKRNHFPHALLLASNDGVPAFRIAQILTQRLLCTMGSLSPCGSCNSCNMVENHQHPDVLHSFPFIKVDKGTTCEAYNKEWSAFHSNRPAFLSHDWSTEMDSGNKQLKIFVAESKRISRFLSLKPYLGIGKVVVIYQSELLSDLTANKLLKSIEEPNPNTFIILVSHNIEGTLTTITSRCQTLNIPPLASNEVFLQDLLINDIEINESLLSVSSRNLGVYLNLITNKDSLSNFGLGFINWLRVCFKFNIKEIMHFSNELSTLGREEVISTLESYFQHFRDAFIEPSGALSPTVMVSLEKLAPFINDSNIQFIYNEIQELLNQLHSNANPKIALLDSSLQLGAALRN